METQMFERRDELAAEYGKGFSSGYANGYADAQKEIVRCAECVHDCKVRDDWFCADGERKEAEHE